MALDRTWYNTLVDDDGTNTTGSRWDKAAVDSLMDAVDAALATSDAAVAAKLPIAGGTLTGDLKFTDALYDIGKSGATRPRDGFFSRNVTVGGLLTVAGIGTHAFSAGGAGKNAINLRNSTAGAGNYAEIAVGNDASAVRSYWEMFTTTYTPAGPALADGMLLENDGAGGISIVAGHASGTLRFYSGGMTQRMGISTAGVVTFNAYTAATFVAGDKYLVVDAAGVIHRSALGPAS